MVSKAASNLRVKESDEMAIIVGCAAIVWRKGSSKAVVGFEVERRLTRLFMF